jgi:hypothetical protein
MSKKKRSNPIDPWKNPIKYWKLHRAIKKLKKDF